MVSLYATERFKTTILVAEKQLFSDSFMNSAEPLLLQNMFMKHREIIGNL